MGRFSDRVVFVTGGASGLGAEACQLFIEEGARVFVTDLEEKNILQRLGDERATFYRCDVADPESCEIAIKACIEKHGRLDVLYANAGMGCPLKTVAEQPIDVFQQVVQTNLNSLFYLARVAIPCMQRQGKGTIVATASTAGLGADAGLGPYCASKAGIINLCRVLALEHAHEGIRINAICPGLMDTPMTHPLIQHESGKQLSRQTIPMKRPAHPSEVARVAVFLASDDASYMTGQAVVVDGGISIKSGDPEFFDLKMQTK